MKQITHSDFVEQFKPRMDEHNEKPLDIDPRTEEGLSTEEFLKAAQEGKIWTLIDSEPYPVVTSGLHYVNRLEHYLCEVPVINGDQYEEVDDSADPEDWTTFELADYLVSNDENYEGKDSSEIANTQDRCDLLQNVQSII